MSSISIVLLLIGILIGAVTTYLVYRSKSSASESIWKDQIEAIGKERNALQERMNGLLALEGVVGQLQSQVTSLEQNVRDASQERDAERERRAKLDIELEASSRAIAEKEEALVRERARFMQEQKQLEDSFQNLSKQALASAQNTFLELANQKFSDERKVSQKEIDEVLAPMKQTLEQLNSHTKEIEEKRTSSYAELSLQVRSLMSTTSQLSNALKRPEVRGSWGELTLKRTAEAAGLVEGTDFTMQESTNTEDGRLRPDMVVKLSNNKTIIVDSKAPLDAYTSAMHSEDATERALKLKEHAAQVKKHIGQLASKQYQGIYADTADFVVMFVPSEALYQMAIQEDPALLEDAFNKKVILANPMTLVALLRTIANGMRQQKAYENSLQIAKLGGELHDAIATFASHYIAVGKSLTSAVRKFDDSVGSLERTIMPKTRRLTELGSKTAKELEAVDPINIAARTPSLPSLVELESGENESSLF